MRVACQILLLAVLAGHVRAEENTWTPLQYPGEMVVKVLDPDGKALAGLKVEQYLSLEKRKPGEPPRLCPLTTATTNQDGTFKIKLPHEPQFIHLTIRDPRYVPILVDWFCVERLKMIAGSLPSKDRHYKYSTAWEAQTALQGRIDKLPASYTIRMQKGFAIGGRIINEQGQPVSGAVIRISAGRGSFPTAAFVMRPYMHGVFTTSDHDGRWHFDHVTDQVQYSPTDKAKVPYFRIEHPDYETPEEHSHRDGNMYEYSGSWDYLRKQTCVLMLRYQRPSRK
ncbi:MAG: carboxypeptidase-like regulatory domain-containing protein [Candidatus Sumerlaeia bacterium]